MGKTNESGKPSKETAETPTRAKEPTSRKQTSNAAEKATEDIVKEGGALLENTL
jgi:hypothetical protein